MAGRSLAAAVGVFIVLAALARPESAARALSSISSPARSGAAPSHGTASPAAAPRAADVQRGTDAGAVYARARALQASRLPAPPRVDCTRERCDGVDNDCDGRIDEAGALDCTLFYEDRDGDLFGAPGAASCSCLPEHGMAANDFDCDDSERMAHPGALEHCDGEIDNDCDGTFDLCGAWSRQALQPGDVIVQRVQERSAGRIDADGEWFELANRTDRAYELMGLEIRDDGVDRFRIDRSLVIPARGRLVLARNGDPATNGGRAVDYVYPDFILSDFGDAIELVNRGMVLDRMRYGPR
jgi:hypothetical protein